MDTGNVYSSFTVIAKSWKKPRCPSKMGYYMATRKKKWLLHE